MAPGPGVANDFVNARVLGSPAEDLPREIGLSDELGRVAIAARKQFMRDWFAAGGLNRMKHFENTHAFAGSKIYGCARVPVGKIAETGRVGEAKICDVDVVADGGSVRSWVVCTEYFDGRALTESTVNDQRDEVRLRPVHLSNLAVRVCASCVEIAQRQATEVPGARVPVQEALHEVFCFAIGVNGAFGSVFRNGA